jgi:hypothetical protein
MGIGRLIGHLIKGKILAATAVGAILVGGTTVALAATPVGQNVVHTITGAHDTPSTGQHTSQDQHPKDTTANNHKGKCSGIDEAQKLAARFSLSTASTSDGIQAICSLHEGTFRGKTPNGSSVSSDHVFGYGEIDQLLTHAKDLATHDQKNTTHKLTDSNVEGYLAEALQSSDDGKKNNPESTDNEKNNNHGNSDTNNNNHGNSDTNNNSGNQNDKSKNGGNSNSTNNANGNNTGEGHGKPTGTPTTSTHN